MTSIEIITLIVLFFALTLAIGKYDYKKELEQKDK